MRVLSTRPPKRDLDRYVCARPRRDIAIRRATVADVAPLLGAAKTAITDGLAGAGHVSRVLAHNGECIFVVERAAPGGGRAVGFHAFLPLSPEGEAALLGAAFAFRRPGLRHIAVESETPSALYWWASLGAGSTASAISLIMERLRAPRYRALDIYARPATAHGARALVNTGFRPLYETADPVGAVLTYRRIANRGLAASPRLNEREGAPAWARG